jgi:hypothetical protein
MHREESGWEVSGNGGPSSTVAPEPGDDEGLLQIVNERTKVLLADSARFNSWRDSITKRVDGLEASQAATRRTVDDCLHGVRSCERGIEKIGTWVEAQEARQASTEARLESASALATTHDKLFKPTVLVRNTLMFAGGILAYLGHLLLKHFSP